MNDPVSLIRTPPHWCPTATPTKRGWVNPINGELLVGTKFIDPSLYSTTKVEEPPTSEPKVAETITLDEPKTTKEVVVDVKDSVKQPKPKKQSFLEKLKGKK